VTPREPTAQDASGSTIVLSDDLRVDRHFTADAFARALGHVVAQYRWRATLVAHGAASSRFASSLRIGYGNAGAVDGTERRPPRLGNLAAAREIPTFPQPLLCFVQEKENDGRKEHDRYHRTRDHRHTADRPATITELRGGRQRRSFANPSPAEIVVADRQK
jgi:hypothetical protein